MSATARPHRHRGLRLAWMLRAAQAAALALAGALLAWGHASGWPALALLALAACAVLPFAAQAGEMAASARVWGDDPTPRPTLAQWWRAWLGEVAASTRVFAWWLPWRHRAEPDHLAGAARGAGVLLVHGYLCNRGIWRGWMRRLRAQGIPFVAVDLEPVLGRVEDTVPALEAGLRRLEAATTAPVVVVAHSMGGMVLRRWWVDHDGDRRVHRAITLGTPHRGTWLARLGLSPNARQMRVGSAWIAALQAVEPANRAQRFTCFRSGCDNVVFPPGGATLPGADDRLLEGVAHVAMVDHRAVWVETLRALDQASRLSRDPGPCAAAADLQAGRGGGPAPG